MLYHRINFACILKIAKTSLDKQFASYYIIYNKETEWALNADIVVYYPVLDIALELSSMGIRVDREALLSQLEKAGCPERAELPFQKSILDETVPFTIGGGIGQSRICMFFLRKAHIGEVQCSLWPEEVMQEAEKVGLQLL